MAKEKFNNIVGTTIISKIIGLTPRRVQQLANEGILSVDKENKNLKFDIFVTIPEYLKFKEAEFKENSLEADIAKSEKRKAQAEADLKSHKAKMAKLELAEMEGEMHRSCDVEEMTAQLVYAVKNRLLSLPGKLAIDLARVDDPAQISAIIQNQVYDILEDLSNYEYEPEKYEKKVRERIGWKLSNDEKNSTNDNQGQPAD